MDEVVRNAGVTRIGGGMERVETGAGMASVEPGRELEEVSRQVGGTRLADFLYPEPARRDVWSIVRWWERRRLPYNLVVGGVGLVSLAVSVFFSVIPPLGAFPGLRLVIPVAVFAVFANLCYLLGPTVEVLVDKIWGRRVLPTGPVLFRMGLTFSVGLALLPALMMIIVWIARVVSVVF